MRRQTLFRNIDAGVKAIEKSHTDATSRVAHQDERNS
jgi:hypothetical protein